MLTAVIPTRNRPDDLAKAVASVCAQTRPPDEFMIVDQSQGDESRLVVESLMSREEGIRLVYIHDQKIAGLVAAKRVAAERATGDIVCFLEDDVILESDYFEQIEQGFATKPDMLGCCGIVTNMPRQPFGYEFIFHLFHRGIFRDKRVGIFGKFDGQGHTLIPSDMISGGMSAWRKEVFPIVPFDVANGFHLLEDNDFSTRVARHFGSRLYINPNARLEHHWSPVNRDVLGSYQRRKLIAYITYYKKRKDWPGAVIAFPWLLVGLCFEATFKSFSSRSVDPILGFFSGVRDGLAKKIVTETILADI
jgi:glycosyltransferase involved in cell wall biosynthesis